ncbi:nucleopolyhedrovirus P10 family protein [Streptomyces sp. NPDC059575]|uniref:nucleopolyhedrovirus P10 family protein n=1 Tax=Streptomyces sp. NPDC059575 TaxID=3346872 RepID=UPI0036B60FD3
MTSEWTQVVRQRLGVGRLLPLGGGRDGAWISEQAAGAVLGSAARDEVPGVRLGTLRIGLADPADAGEPVVPPPPSALPPGALRVTADFAATTERPLPVTAELLRTALTDAATRRLGLAVTEVDLRVTDLLGPADAGPEPSPAPSPPSAAEAKDPDGYLVATAARAVPGVTRLTAVLGDRCGVVRTERPAVPASLPRRHVCVELAADPDHRTVEVARAVRTAVRDALEDHPTVAVLVTAVEEPEAESGPVT